MRNLIVLASALTLLAACCDCSATGAEGSHYKRNAWRKPAPIVKPELATPKAHKTCVENFKFSPGTPQYDKCVTSLGEIEKK